MEPVAIVTALILLQFIVLGMLVGRARGKYKIRAPATTGDPIFERHFRAHQNSLEQLVVTIPALWMFAYYVHAGAAAVLGVVYLFGRALYYQTYVADPAKRSASFGIGILASGILVLGGLAGAGWHWLK
mgnify:CR=1 FL=1